MKICSSGNKEKLQVLINKFYCSENCVINDNNEVYNTKLNRRIGFVVYKRGTYTYHGE